MMSRSGWYKFHLLCAVLGVLLHSRASQSQVNFPVRPVLTELGLLQGKCPSTPASSSSGLQSGSGLSSGSGIDSGSGSVQSGSGGASLSSTSGSASGSGFLCMSVDIRVGAFCAIALRERLCPFLFFRDTCSMCINLSVQCGPLSGDIGTVCSGASSMCSTLDTQHCEGSSGVLAYLCDFCWFVQENCLVSSESSGKGVSGSTSASGFSGVSGSGSSASGFSGVSGSGSSASGFSGVSGSGSSASGFSGVSGSGSSASGFSGVSGSGSSASGFSAVSGSGSSASGFSGVSGSGSSVSRFSGVSGSGSSVSRFSGVSGSGSSASGSSGVSGGGSSASGFSGVSGSGSSASEFSSTSGSGGFSGEAGSAVSGSGFSGVGGSESGSGDVCSNLFQAVGPICAAVLQANPCRYEYSSQTCNTCQDLFLSCGQPEGGDIATFCSSEMAQSCSGVFNIVFENLFDYCTFVWSMCYPGTIVENDLCFVEGLLVVCTNLQLLSGEYPCECFLPSSQCSLCTSVVSICEPPTPTLPVAIVDVTGLTPEQAENSVTIVFGGITVADFNAKELQFRVAIADIVNLRLLAGLPSPDRPKRQAEAVQNVTADNVFIVGPSPLITESGLQAVFFVQTNSGALINGTALTEAVESEGPTLAQEVGATDFRVIEGLPLGFGQVQPTSEPTIQPTPSTISMVVEPSSAIVGTPQQPTPLSSQTLPPPGSIAGTTEAIRPTMAPPQPTESMVSTQPPGQLGEGDIAAIVVFMSIATLVILVVSAVVLYYIQRRRRKYHFRIGSGSKYYGKYIHSTNTFGRPSITSDMGKFAGDDIPMEKKLGTLPFTAVVATNPVALEPGIETFMLDKSGEFRESGEIEDDLLEESCKDTQL